VVTTSHEMAIVLVKLASAAIGWAQMEAGRRRRGIARAVDDQDP
jgi:hypothetical protein